jgi:hypothetical protein
MNLNELVTGVVLEKVCSIKPDGDSTEKKSINLRVKFDGIPLQAVFDKAVSGAVIQWQNGPGRSKFDAWRNNQTVEITFAAPGRTTVDPESAMIERLRTMTPEEKEAKIREMIEKAI